MELEGPRAGASVVLRLRWAAGRGWDATAGNLLLASTVGCLGDSSLTKGPVAVGDTPYAIAAPDSIHAVGPILLLQAYVDSAASASRPGVAQPNGGDYPKSRTGNRVMMRATLVLAFSQRLELGVALDRVSERTAFVWSKEHSADPARRVVRIEP